MKRYVMMALLALPSVAQETIAVVGLEHSHVWSHLPKMVKGEPAKLVGIAESNPDLVAEAKKAGAADKLFYTDFKLDFVQLPCRKAKGG